MAHGNHVHRVAFGAVTVVAWYSISWQTQERLDYPVPSIVFALLLCGTILRLVDKVYPRDSENSSKREEQDFPAILEDGNIQESKRHASTARRFSQPPPLYPQSRRRRFVILVGHIVLRVETLGLIVEHTECTTKNLEVILLLLLLAIQDFVATERSQNEREENDSMWSSSLFLDVYFAVTPSRARFLPPTLLLCFGVFLTSRGELSSTYVCFIKGSSAHLGVAFQGAAVILDYMIILDTWQILRNNSGEKRKLETTGAIMLYSATILSFLSIPSLLYSSVGLNRIPSIELVSIWPILADGTALAVALLCFIYIISEIRPLILIIVFFFAWLYTPLIQTAWTSFTPFPPQWKGTEAVGLLVLFGGFTIFMHISSFSERSNSSVNFAKRIPIWLYVLLTISFLVTEGIYLSETAVVGFHPINFLMYNARIDGDRWLVHASSSISLETAVAEYRSRYRGRAPPPNFDKWYDFAIKRGCIIIDDYDQIDKDLLPFWAVPPARIREQSPLQLPSNDIFALRIRNGLVEVSTIYDADGKWSSEELVAMIQTFAQWLPDMYIGFNMREVPRVAVSWKQIKTLKQRASTIDVSLEAGEDHSFTRSREPDSDWPSIENDYATSSTYKEFVRKTQKSPGIRSRPSVFQRYEAPTCPPSSSLGRSRAWHAQGFCASCAEPHSLGQFIQNWTLAGDLCHQPDMANLHGFLMSPGTDPDVGYSKDQLVPVFSRSKVPGYNDILFPGPGDYVDLTEPRPNEKIFSEMSNTLLWRGPAEDDISTSQTWQGRTPQRLAHLANNATRTTLIPMLLPANEPEKFIYENILASELTGVLDLDVGITECEQCSTKGYLEQKRELGTKPFLDEKQYLNYRYIFVPDVSGASRTFVSFLRSNAVPFRSSIFRSWYDDRLTAWLHYVPIDGRLHAVHSTLAYFAGLKGKLNGRDVEMQSKFGEASFIADQGRKWAEKALRREDAEAYLFRLLLEYGRVVDDRRNEIGFQLEV